MKIVLPVAGNGLRLRPYTEDRPKCLLPLAGKTIIDWIVDDAIRLKPTETIFITGYKAEKIDEFLKSKPEWGAVRTVLQSDPQGLGEAISLSLPYINDDEPLLIILGDTLFEADLSILKNAQENILYTYKVEDPKRFGVAVVGEGGCIERLVEKPQEFVSDEAIVGIYYIKDVKALKESLKYLMDNNIRTKGEFQLTDALERMIEMGCKFRTAPVSRWLDCGLVETLLDTNAHVLKKNDNSKEFSQPGVEIIPPCFIGKNAKIHGCKIGPFVAIGEDCELSGVEIRDAIVWNGVKISNGIVKDTVVHK
ncbi:sugar phosphate nucleotidyltransferase [Fibrobacter succinogenes]|uniref:sugar phosphate nucleotidyltransferase n=1 Tax=Fibrobacter succinogenes TaxID=833 RepID=UPI00156475B3|nr:sugar phosphate nucleotidyltransferase [Fibrobacter succinogenes]